MQSSEKQDTLTLMTLTTLIAQSQVRNQVISEISGKVFAGQNENIT
jgi:hypothetical protein